MPRSILINRKIYCSFLYIFFLIYFLIGKDAESQRRQRNETIVELRKAKRDDTLNKKRFQNGPQNDFDLDEDETRISEEMIKPNLKDIVSNAQSPNPDVQLNAIQCE